MSDSPTSEFDPAIGYDDSSWPGHDGEVDPFAADVAPSWSDPDALEPGGSDGCCVPEDRPIPALPGADTWAPNGTLVLSVDGSSLNLGIPTLDMDGDGRPDSTLVDGGDGQLYLVSDLTGDGLADGVVIADQHGTVLSGFEIENGVVIPVHIVPGTSNLQDLTAFEPPVIPDPAITPEPISGPVAQPLRVSLDLGTEVVDLGPATHDLDGDGIPESVVIPSVDGQPGYVVSELPTGSDGLLVLDPLTGDIVYSFVSDAGVIREGIDVMHELSDVPAAGEEVPVDQIGVAPDPLAPAPSADPWVESPTEEADPSDPETAEGAGTDGPETIVAPTTADLSIPQVALVQQGVQGMYDVASQVWFDLTGGEPYPRADDGTPLNPGQVFGVLIDRPDTSTDALDSLRSMQDNWDSMVTTTVKGTRPE